MCSGSESQLGDTDGKGDSSDNNRSQLNQIQSQQDHQTAISGNRLAASQGVTSSFAAIQSEDLQGEHWSIQDTYARV